LIRSYKDLRVYQISYELALQLHRKTLTLPEFEKYELGQQIRRATKSIPLNIGEGYGRRTAKEFKHFLRNALGSCDEVAILLRFIKDLGYITDAEYNHYADQYDQLGKQLTNLIQRWKEF